MNGVANSEVTQYHQDCNDAVRFVKASFSLQLITIDTAADAESRWDNRGGGSSPLDQFAYRWWQWRVR